MAVLNSWQKPSRVLASDVGTGVEGAYAPSTGEFTLNASSCSGTSGTTVLTVAVPATFTAPQLLLIHQTRGTGAGQWEINYLTSINGSDLNLSTALQYTYSSTGASKAQVFVLHQYSSVNIAGGVTLTVQPWENTNHYGGFMGFVCSGTVTINGVLAAPGGNAIGGFLGGNDPGVASAGTQGEGTAGAGNTKSTAANGSGGGGGGRTNDSTRGGGGGGGHASAGTTGSVIGGGTGGTGGTAVGSADLTSLNLGGGGGIHSTNSGAGGDGTQPGGGGGIIIFCKTLVTPNSITADGIGGYGSSSGGAGGGAGGSVLLVADTLALGTNKITAVGGAGGATSPAGGAGSDGRIAIHYKSIVSGTTNPASTNTQDTSLIIPSAGGGSMFAFL